MRIKRMPDVEFCRKCLEIIDEVHRTRRPIIITRDFEALGCEEALMGAPKEQHVPRLERALFWAFSLGTTLGRIETEQSQVLTARR